MGFKCYIVYVILVSTLIAYMVEGFSLNDVTEVQTPTNAIVEVVLEELDADKDGKISISEVQNRIHAFYHIHLPVGRQRPIVAGNFGAEMTGYLLTFANIADADASGFIERNEIHRFASHLVNLTGVVQVGRIVDFADMINARTHGYQTILKSSISLVMNGIDSNNDGQISEAEKNELVQLQLHNVNPKWWGREITVTFETADVNSDGVLDSEETGQFKEKLSRDYPRQFRGLAVYYRVVSLADRDVADAWMNTPH